jgi:hypothetical protein
MKKIKKNLAFLFFFILFSLNTFALDISDYPFMFIRGDVFDPVYVIGEESPSEDVIIATVFSTAISKYPEYSVEVGTAVLDSEVDDVKKLNAIVIGNPCINSAAAELEGNPSFCYEGLEGGKAYAKLFFNNGKWQLLITGVSSEDRMKMAEFLTENHLGNIKSKTFSINTGTGSITPQKPVYREINSFFESSESESFVFDEDENVEHVVISVEEPEVNIDEKEKNLEFIDEEVSVLEVKDEKKGFFSSIFSGIASFFRYIFG